LNGIDHLVWLDLETTGSSEDKGDEIIEIGCILTNTHLDEISRFTSVVQPTALGLGRLMENKVVWDMHEQNGLLNDVLYAVQTNRPDTSLNHVTNRILGWLAGAGAQRGHTVMAGSGVGHFDSRFVRKYMPQLQPGFLKYWVIDIGVIRRAHEMWVGTAVSNENDNKTHRALDDARCHLNEARAYRDLWQPRVED
jgi:oligoribonuclease